jgi:hypothetical protein
MRYRKVKDPFIARLDRITRQIGRKATKHPVFLEVRNLGRKERRTAAMLEMYEKPTEYVVVLTPELVRGCKETYGSGCPREMKKFLAHEIAHINAPDEHGPGFRRECIRLGGGDRCTARGAKTDPLHRWHERGAS